jgi:hypothetical protein
VSSSPSYTYRLNTSTRVILLSEKVAIQFVIYTTLSRILGYSSSSRLESLIALRTLLNIVQFAYLAILFYLGIYRVVTLASIPHSLIY